MTRFERLVPTESEEQQALFRFCAVEMQRYPELDMLVHIPNEGKRTQSTGGRLKKEGLRKGFPDLMLCTPHCGYAGLVIELKRKKGSKISEEQKEWIRKLNYQCYAAVFCYGWEEAWNVIKAYLLNDHVTVKANIKSSLEKAREAVYDG